MKKILLQVIILMIIVSISLLGAGCKETVAEETVAEETAKEKIVINQVHMAGGENRGKIMQDIVAEKLPNIELNMVYLDFSSLHDKMVTNAVTGSDSYDLLWVLTDWCPEFMGSNFLEPLNNYIDEDPIEGWPAYPDGVMGIQTTSDGKIYGIPAHDGPYMLFYRTDLFDDPKEKSDFQEEYGYELAPPENWQQFKEIADFFTRPDEELWGTSYAGNDPQSTAYDLIQIAHNNGGQYFDDNGNPTFNTDAWVKSLEFLGEMYKDNSPKGSEQIDMLGRADQFKEGVVAMYADWTGYADWFSSPPSKIIDKFSYALMPEGDSNRDSMEGYWVYSISESSTKKDAAWEVIKVLSTVESDLKLTLAKESYIGVRNSTIENPEVAEASPYYITMGEILDGNAFYGPFSVDGAKIYDEIRIAVQNYNLGKGSAQDLLNTANDNIAAVVTE